MRTSAVITLVVSLLAACNDEPRLDAGSLFALYQSTESMKQELKLSEQSAGALDNAIDVLVGDATRALVAEQEAHAATAQQEANAATADEERARAEAFALAAVHGMTLQQVLATALETRRAELQSLLAELGAEEAVITEQQAHLDRIRVQRAEYNMVTATRRSWIDVTVRNGSDQTLSEVLLDCKLVEPGGKHPREKGTCAVEFAEGLPPLSSATGRTLVGWETEPRSSRRVEARPIRAYGPDHAVLWQVPSELDPREAGRVGDLRTRVAVLEQSMRALEVEPIASD